MGWEVYGNPNYVNRIKDYLDIEKAAGMVASKGYYSNPLESSYMNRYFRIWLSRLYRRFKF